jgi:tetratricopeptide (TPR) repeat protein
MHIFERGTRAAVGALTLSGLGLVAAAASEPQTTKPASDTIPITTSSEEARQLYLKGRDLSEKLRLTDSRRLFEEAVAKDKGFALAQVGLANTAGTAKEFFDAMGRAVVLAGKVSEPERLIVLGLEAGAKGEVARQKECYTMLTATYPNDARGFNLLGGHYFGQQDYPAAVAAYSKATAIDPNFSQPYNQLGYAYRFMEKYPEAEQAFKKYIELIPGDPNPYDSYAELLMKTGRFEESIKNYEKALSLDPNFVASYVGIGNDQIFLGRGAEARKTFARLSAVSRNDGEKRLAHFWTAVSYVHEGATDQALAEVQKMAAIAEAQQDGATLSGDWNLMANVLLEAGRPDAALAKFAQQVEAIGKADVPAEVKEAARRNALFNEARVALAKKDLATAKARAAAYGTQVAIKKIPFEVRQQHALLGQIALEEKNPAAAAAELEEANQQDPRVLYLLAVAL